MTMCLLSLELFILGVQANKLHFCNLELILNTGPPRGGQGGQMPRGPATFRGPAGPTFNIYIYILGPRLLYMRGPVTALPRGPDFHSVGLTEQNWI